MFAFVSVHYYSHYTNQQLSIVPYLDQYKTPLNFVNFKCFFSLKKCSELSKGRYGFTEVIVYEKIRKQYAHETTCVFKKYIYI